MQRAKDKVIRRLFGRDSDGQIATDALYEMNGILKVKQLIQLDSILLHRKFQMDFNKFGTKALSNIRALGSTTHHWNTIRFACEEKYNALEPCIRDIGAYDLFKRTLKRFILPNDELEL